MKLKSFLGLEKKIPSYEGLQKCKNSLVAYRERPSHREGAGSLYQEVISALILCELTGKTLVCPPIRYLHHHKSAGDSLQIYLARWAKLFAPLKIHEFSERDNPRLPFLENPKGMLDALPENLFEIGVASLRKKFEIGSTLRSKSRTATIAVHLRNLNQEDEVRGKAGSDYGYFGMSFNAEQNPERNLRRLTCLQKILLDRKEDLFPEAKNLKLVILSQGVLPGIQALENLTEVEYCLDEHPARSFQRMLESNFLVMAQSSFSYLACLLRIDPSLSFQRFRHRLPKNCLIAEIF